MDEDERAHWERRQRERGFLRVRLQLLSAADGGRQGPIFDGYRASWDIGNRTENGEWTSNDAPLLLEGAATLAPGETATARIHPIAPELWTHVSAGLEVTMHEGRRVVGRGEVLGVVGPAEAEASRD